MYTLIIADDEELERQALRLFITTSRLPITVAAECMTGNELIAKASAVNPDIIILDISMPGINGLDALKALRTKNCDSLVIISSAYNTFDYAVTAMQLGVINFLVKPVRRDVFLSAVQKALHMLQNDASIPRASVPPDEIPDSIKKIVAFIDVNYNRQITLDDIASACGYSRYHLSHLFSTATGTTVFSFLLEKRISTAKELLQDKTLSIKEISACTGFSDPNYFSLVFKKQTGLSPVEFRNKL